MNNILISVRYNKLLYSFIPLALSLIFNLGLGCSSARKVETQAYAKLSQQRTFENEFPVVWKAIESAVRNYKIIHRDPNEVTTLELKALRNRKLETDWLYGQSRDKYTEYKINNLPRRVQLQNRIKYIIEAQSVIGGVTVSVHSQEEVERLNEDGSSAGYERVDLADSSRGADLLDKIQTAILAAPPTQDL